MEFFAKREFDYLAENDQPGCMIRMGTALALNISEL
jgi:hypothetical protein